jgi:PAS domain S-box-containing protein
VTTVKLTVSQKGLVLVCLPLLFQLGFVLAVVRFQSDHTEAERWAAHTKEVIARAHEIHTHVNDVRAGVQGYVITAEPKFAEPYRRARADMPGHFDELFTSVQDNPEQTEQARKVHATANAMVDWLSEVEQLVRDGARDEASARVRSRVGYDRMEEFRREFAIFLAEEERLDRERQAALQQSRNRLNAVFVLGGVAAVACTLLLAYGFRRGIARRFSALETTAHRLAAGEALSPALDGSDEMARLDRAFRDMAAQLTHASDAVRDLYDNAPCGYHSVDANGTLVAVNRTELAWLGYEAAEVVGRMRFADLVSPAGRDAYRQGFARVKEHGAVGGIELELMRKDGTTFPVLVSSSSVRDAEGRYLRSRTTLTDLTERKRAEAAVRLFADVAHNIPIGLLIYQLDGTGDASTLRVRSGNRDASRLLGVPLDEATGHAVIDVFPAIPADQLRRYIDVAATGAADDLGEFRYGDARVTERWWAVLAFPLPDRSVGVAFQDVTARKRAEAEVRRLNEELEQRVRSRTAELETANRDLAQKNTENEMFVYSVSHDLRSPLVNLQGFSKELEKAGQLLTTTLGGAPPEVQERGRAILDGKMAKSIGFIQSAVLRLSGIIDALLRLSRAGRVEYRREVVDLAGVVAQVVGAAQGTIAERGAVIRVGELPSVWGDRTAVEQVFGNLIGNALTYLDPARPGVIEVGCLPPMVPGFRTFFVRDNGLGIAEGHRQKIFQAFQRAHPGIGSGEGLGLAIVARVAERHRGRVWVESKPGEGSTFFVTLPTDAGGR